MDTQGKETTAKRDHGAKNPGETSADRKGKRRESADARNSGSPENKADEKTAGEGETQWITCLEGTI